MSHIHQSPRSCQRSDCPRVVAAGDFAVLLKAGMTVKQAIVYNLLSAMMAYVGMLIGTAVGQYANNITLWIFAITAGMFLYVALVDMVRGSRFLLP